MIIGVTGTNGAGKGTVVEYLVQKGYKHYSAGECIADEIQKRGLPMNRDSMNLVGNDIRRTKHPAYLFEMLYKRAITNGGDVVIEAMRAVAEGEYLKEQKVPIIAVDANREIRYGRIVKRGSAKDAVSFEQFCMQEDREMNAPEAHDMNISGVMRLADFRITNNGTLEELHAQIDAVLQKVKK